MNSVASAPPSRWQLLPQEPEFVIESISGAGTAVVEKKLTAWERLYNLGYVRKSFLLAAFALVWQVYASWLGSDLLLPTFLETLRALWDGILDGEILGRAWASLRVLLVGYGLGIILAALLTVLAISTRLGNDLLESATAMFNPLPAIALLPLALIWFGLGNGSLVFVLIHSVVWPVALNTYSGFQAVSNTLRMVGRNTGLRGFRYVTSIMIPAASCSIITGFKIGWAFSWRTLIAAELVFGVSSGSGGLGWFIYVAKNNLETAQMFAGLLALILIGLFVETVIFRQLEAHTVRKWGMQH